MKSSSKLPGPQAWTAVEDGDARHPRRPLASRAARAVLYLVVPLLVLSSVLHIPIYSGGLDQIFRCRKPKTIEERVERILHHTPLIDGHNDLAVLIRSVYNNHIYNESFSKPFAEGGLVGHVDLPRLRVGMNGGAFWSVYWSCPENGTDYSDENYHDIVQATLQQIDLLARLQQAYPATFLPPTLTSTEALRHFHGRHHDYHRDPHNHPLISPLGIEGLHQIGNSPALLRAYHALGVRYATLTHNCGNRFADAALWESRGGGGGGVRKAPPVWGGVSPAGRQLVREMNRLGVIVDLAHTSVGTMLDVLGAREEGERAWEGSRAPVIFSHSSAYALCPHPRNVPDEVLDWVGRKGGLVMVNFNPGFVSCVEAPDREDGLPEFYPQNSTLQHVARHVLHIGKRIGFEHVGLGSDFDGIAETPRGLEDVSKFPDLVAELLRQGVSDEDAAKVVGGNILRVWGEVERVAAEMQKAGEPVLEDDLPSLYSR